MGFNPRKFIPLVLVGVVVVGVTGDAVSRMIFGALGQTPAHPAWPYVLVLYTSLAIAGAGSAVRSMTATTSMAGRVATILSGTASGALLAFYYAGTATDNNPQIASLAAVVGAVTMAIAIFRFHHRLLTIMVAAAGAVTGYGFAFLAGMTASAGLSTPNLVWGVIWATLSLGYIGLTILSLTLVIREISQSS